MAGGCCFGCIIVLLNTFFGIIGLLFIAIGSVVHFIGDIISTYFKDILKTMGDALGGTGIDINELLEGDATLNIMGILRQVAIPFIVVGVLLFAICILGCCSVYCSSKTLVTVYISILGLVLAAQVLAFVIVYVKLPDYRDEAIANLKTAVANDYEGPNLSNEPTNFFTTFVDLIQMQVKCCGVDSYTNFENATKWQAKKTTAEQIIPLSCCVLGSDQLPIDLEKCAKAEGTDYAYTDTPCCNKVDELLSGQKTIVIAVIAVILALQAIILMLALCYCQSIGSKVGPV